MHSVIVITGLVIVIKKKQNYFLYRLYLGLCYIILAVFLKTFLNKVRKDFRLLHCRILMLQCVYQLRKSQISPNTNLSS